MNNIDRKIIDEIMFDTVQSTILDETMTVSKLSARLNLPKSSLYKYMSAVAVYEVVKCFLNTQDLTIQELAIKMKMSRSTVQRYLNSELIDEIPEFRGRNISNKIKKILAENKKNGNKLGGIVSAENNIYQKDKYGVFIGCKKR